MPELVLEIAFAWTTLLLLGGGVLLLRSQDTLHRILARAAVQCAIANEGLHPPYG